MAMMPQYFPGMPEGSTMGDAARMMLKTEYPQWQPIYGWWANQPKYLPLADGTPGTASNGAAVNPDWRRKVIAINFTVAQIWDGAAGNDGTLATDLNHDGAEADGENHTGGILWDPPIQRDMKAGMNFAGGPFGTIPVGFGTGSYDNAYNADFTFSGDFDYVGIYGGNAILTTPEQIDAYKTWRGTGTAGVSGIDKDWSDVQLVFFGGNPFQVQHNVVRTGKYVLGTSCDDCHSPTSGFFSGDYDMTGTAVPASNEYDFDASGYTFGMNMADPTASNMFARPVVDYEVTALKADLRTGSEAVPKNGSAAFIDVEFDECLATDRTTVVDCEDGEAVYRRTHDLDKSAFFYPELHHDATALMDRIACLEDLASCDKDAATLGIGATPVAGLIGVNGATSTGGTAAIEVTKGAAVTLTSEGVTPTSGTVTFSAYNINDGACVLDAAGEPVSVDADDDCDQFITSDYTVAGSEVTFNDPGVYRVLMTATAIDGKTAQSYQYVTVAEPAHGSESMTFAVAGNVVTLTLTVGDIPADAVKARIKWADDENYQYYSTIPVDGIFNKIYTGTPAGEVVKVIFYNADNLNIDAWSDTVQ